MESILFWRVYKMLSPNCVQVGFLSGICLPCYNILKTVIPESAPLLEGVNKNLERWKTLYEEQKIIQEARERNAEKSETPIANEVNGDGDTNGSPDSSTSSKSISKQSSQNVPVTTPKSQNTPEK